MSWIATVQADIGRLFRTAHRTLGTDPDDQLHGLYQPDNPRDKAAQAMQAAARRGNDTDGDYARIPDPTIRTWEPSDPTSRTAERALEEHVATGTLLAELLDDWYTAVGISLHMFGRDVIGPASVPIEPPDVMWDHTGGRRTLNIGPADVGRFVTETCAWMWWAAQALDRATAEGDAHEDRLRSLQQRTRHTVNRIRRRQDRIPPSRRPCLNPGGLHNHMAGDGQVNGICRRCRNYDWCSSCGRNPRAVDSEGYTRSDCWSCIGKKKRARQTDNELTTSDRSE